MRWAKAPEWLLCDLVQIPRAPRDAAPGNALLAFVVLGVNFADWQTREATASQRELADATGLSRSSVGRCVELLERVRALDVLAGRAGWRGRSRFLLAGDSPLPTGGHLHRALPTGGHDCPTGGHLRVVETAGQDPARCPPVGRTTQVQESSPEEIDVGEEDVWGLLEPATLPGLKAPMPRLLSERGVTGALLEMRAACEDPRRTPRLSDLGATRGSDPATRAQGAGSTTDGEDRSR